MKDIEEILKNIINDYGVTVYKNQNQIMALLKDYLEGENKKEIIALMLTVEEGIVDKIAEAKNKSMLDDYIKLLCDTTPTSEKIAAWAVGVWYYSFGILGKEDISSYEDDSEENIIENETPVNVNHKTAEEIYKLADTTPEEVEDSYKILNLNYNDEIEKVIGAYKGLAKKYNPSKFDGGALRKLAEQKTKEINSAKEILNKYLSAVEELNINSSVNKNITNTNTNISLNKNAKSALLSANRQYNSRKIKISVITIGTIFLVVILFLILMNVYQRAYNNVSSQAEMSVQGKEKGITPKKEVNEETAVSNQDDNSGKNMYNQGKEKPISTKNQENEKADVSSKADNGNNNMSEQDEEKPITFKNKAIEQAVRIEINKLSGDISKADIEEVTKLNLKTHDISDISDLKQITYLSELDLSNNKIQNISPLASLASLNILKLKDNGITNIRPLANLTNINELDLGNNKIKDISPLTSLIYLSSLKLDGNGLTNISLLSKMEGLTELDLSDNKIQNINSLTNFPNLSILRLNGNGLTNISPLGKMAGLTELDLGNNKIQNICLLTNLPNLSVLRLNGNGLTNISPLAKMISLTELDLYYNHISNIKPLSNLTGLTYLKLSNNQISDISSLASLTNVTQLYISKNPIKDFSAIRSMERLEHIVFSKDQPYKQILQDKKWQIPEN